MPPCESQQDPSRKSASAIALLSGYFGTCSALWISGKNWVRPVLSGNALLGCPTGLSSPRGKLRCLL